MLIDPCWINAMKRGIRIHRLVAGMELSTGYTFKVLNYNVQYLSFKIILIIPCSISFYTQTSRHYVSNKCFV